MKVYFFSIRKNIFKTLIITTIILCKLLVLFSLLYNPIVTRFQSVASNNVEKGKLAIIIDDFGSTRDGVDEMLSLNRPLTFAIMPFCEYTEDDAKAAYEKGFEIILHLPMEALTGKRSWLGSRPILADMDQDTIKAIVRDSITNVPHAVGANIHMGAKASSDAGIMEAVLDIVKENNLYFVDSRTASKPVAKSIAKDMGILCYERDVFLDGQQPISFVKNRLLEAGKLALENGHAVAIGHVGIEGGKVTVQAIKEMIPVFDEMNVELVFISEIDNSLQVDN